MSVHEIRLLDCCMVNEEWTEGEETLFVNLFGLNEQGETFKIIVDDFRPYFYCMVPNTFSKQDCAEFRRHIVQAVGNSLEESIECTLQARRKLYGFNGGHTNRFVCFQFNSMRAYRTVKNLWFGEVATRDVSAFGRRPGFKWALKGKGYYYRGNWLELYEAHIPPILRFFHVHDISPTGWIEITGSPVPVKSSSCMHELRCGCAGVRSLMAKETLVPYKICSFDIEASSRTGDFPMPVCDYRRCAQQIMEAGPVHSAADLRTALLAAFGYAEHAFVEALAPKRPITQREVDAKIEAWLAFTLDGLDAVAPSVPNPLEEEEEDVEEDAEGDESAATVCGRTMASVMQDARVPKDMKLQALLTSLNKQFPALEGDQVTFIGSTFVRYGVAEPYLNHCIALGETTPVANIVLECYATEREVLLAWSDLVRREDPDIIIGYNIFGFDEEFMFRRALENACAPEFLNLTRNRSASAAKKIDGEWQLEEKSVFLASGEYALKYFNLEGRLQIDLYTMFRKEQYNFESYKLDDVAAIFISDKVTRVEYDLAEEAMTVFTKKTKGVAVGNYVVFEYFTHTSNRLMEGKKFRITEIVVGSHFVVEGCINGVSQVPPELMGIFVSKYASAVGSNAAPTSCSMSWCLVKDDVDHHQIFAWAKGSPDDRAKIAAYCIQDCNLVHHLMQKVDVLTAYIEMGNVCSVTLKDIVFRGQGIKVTSFVSKKCREHKVLMPVLPSVEFDDGYEGAFVLDPKCGVFTDDPVGVCDFKSLYPCNMIANNLSQDSKVWAKEYDLEGNLLRCQDYGYDGSPGYKFVDCTYDLYKSVRKTPKGKAEKVKNGVRTVRWAQFPDGKMGILPMVLDELLKARSSTRKKAAKEPDEFMRNVYDKRQLAYKMTANSLYGQCGARTSTFYDKDVAACCTSIGRTNLIYAKTVIETVYQARLCTTKSAGEVTATAEYVYGDTDSVFFKFTLLKDGVKLKGMEALPLTIELAQEAGELATMFLNPPHELEYEKTFYPFILLSKKRYVGMLYEHDPTQCERKSMGIVLKRRDNAPIVKDIYGGLIDHIMAGATVGASIKFIQTELQKLVQGKFNMDKLKITKSLRSGYKNPNQIAHKVLADRIGVRDPGNKPRPGDRIQFIYVKIPPAAKGVRLLQGEKIETPEFVKQHDLQPDVSHYITNQIMKPIQQVFALVLEEMPDFDRAVFDQTVAGWRDKYAEKPDKWDDKMEQVRQNEVKRLLFAPFLK